MLGGSGGRGGVGEAEDREGKIKPHSQKEPREKLRPPLRNA